MGGLILFCLKANTHIYIVYTRIYILYRKHFKDVSREFDEFQVNTHLCKLRCWHLLVIYYVYE